MSHHSNLTQRSIVLYVLQTKGYIDNETADILVIKSLPARVWELRHINGWSIDTIKTEDGETIYQLASPKPTQTNDTDGLLF